MNFLKWLNVWIRELFLLFLSQFLTCVLHWFFFFFCYDEVPLTAEEVNKGRRNVCSTLWSFFFFYFSVSERSTGRLFTFEVADFNRKKNKMCCPVCWYNVFNTCSVGNISRFSRFCSLKTCADGLLFLSELSEKKKKIRRRANSTAYSKFLSFALPAVVPVFFLVNVKNMASSNRSWISPINMQRWREKWWLCGSLFQAYGVKMKCGNGAEKLYLKWSNES